MDSRTSCEEDQNRIIEGGKKFKGGFVTKCVSKVKNLIQGMDVAEFSADGGSKQHKKE